jgi:hypothetical protein
MNDFSDYAAPVARSAPDPLWRSKRIGAGFFGLLAPVLAEPSVQAGLAALLPAFVPAPLVPIAGGLLSFGLAAWSKAAEAEKAQ